MVNVKDYSTQELISTERKLARMALVIAINNARRLRALQVLYSRSAGSSLHSMQTQFHFLTSLQASSWIAIAVYGQ